MDVANVDSNDGYVCIRKWIVIMVMLITNVIVVVVLTILMFFPCATWGPYGKFAHCGMDAPQP